jgi:chromosome segregation ATPase
MRGIVVTVFFVAGCVSPREFRNEVSAVRERQHVLDSRLENLTSDVKRVDSSLASAKRETAALRTESSDALSVSISRVMQEVNALRQEFTATLDQVASGQRNDTRLNQNEQVKLGAALEKSLRTVDEKVSKSLREIDEKVSKVADGQRALAERLDALAAKHETDTEALRKALAGVDAAIGELRRGAVEQAAALEAVRKKLESVAVPPPPSAPAAPPPAPPPAPAPPASAPGGAPTPAPPAPGSAEGTSP